MSHMGILIRAFKNWLAREPFTQSAAAAYYAIFSFPGLLIIVIGFAGLFLEAQTVEQEVLTQLEKMLGADAATNIHQVIQQTQIHSQNHLALIIGMITLLFGATGLFVQIQRSLNHIWQVEVKKSAPLYKFLTDRLISLSMIAVIGFVFLVSLIITTLLMLFSQWLADRLPEIFMMFMSLFSAGLSLLTVTVLFALIFKILPDAKVPWRPALAGGFVSAILFNAGKYVLTSYVLLAQPQSAFGGAGAVVLLMIWVFYSCMILFFGAEFSRAWAEARLKSAVPATDIAKKTA